MQELSQQYLQADNRDDWRTALAVAEQAVAQYPQDAQAWAMRARAWFMSQNPEAAYSDVSRALSLDAHCALAVATDAGLKYDDGLDRLALGKLNDAIQRLPPNAQLHIARGYQLKLAGNAEAALQDFARAIEIEPNLQRGYTNTAGTLQEMGRDDEALAFWEQSAMAYPGNGELAYNAGTALYMVKIYDRAIGHLDRARLIIGERNDVQMNRAMTLFQLGRFADAVGEWQQLYRREPKWDWVLSGLYKSYYHLGDLPNATRYAQELDQLMGDLSATNGLSTSLYRDDRYEDLITLLQPVVEKHPDLNPGMRMKLGVALRSQKRFEEARTCLETASKLHPGTAGIEGELANVLFKGFGEHEKALDHVQLAMSLDPDDAYYRRVREEILEAQRSASKGRWLKRLFGGK